MLSDCGSHSTFMQMINTDQQVKKCETVAFHAFLYCLQAFVALMENNNLSLSLEGVSNNYFKPFGKKNT